MDVANCFHDAVLLSRAATSLFFNSLPIQEVRNWCGRDSTLLFRYLSACDHVSGGTILGVCSAFTEPSLNFSLSSHNNFWHLGCLLQSQEKLMRYWKVLA